MLVGECMSSDFVVTLQFSSFFSSSLSFACAPAAYVKSWFSHQLAQSRANLLLFACMHLQSHRFPLLVGCESTVTALCSSWSPMSPLSSKRWMFTDFNWRHRCCRATIGDETPVCQAWDSIRHVNLLGIWHSKADLFHLKVSAKYSNQYSCF